MCIIADNVNDVSKTMIACFHVGFTFDGENNNVNQNNRIVTPAQLTIYSANIDSQTNSNALILPIYNPSNNPKKIIPLDFSSEPNFFDDLESIYAKWFGSEMLNKAYNFTNSFDSDDSILEVHKVGDYKFSIMPSKIDFNRLDRLQLNINPASKNAIDMHNNNYSFIVYQFYQKGKINISPFGYLTECDINNQNLMIPTIHGHPHDGLMTGIGFQPYASASYNSGFEDTAHYDHTIYTLVKDNENLSDLVSGAAGRSALLATRSDLPNFQQSFDSNFTENNFGGLGKYISANHNDVVTMNNLLKK